MRWTDSQREAIELRGRRVLVSAGAGSGKTRVLVERFLRLLEENADWHVSDIVAVTFTEKAAREMRARIRREIRSRIEKTSSADERRRWRDHRNALDSARIGTIHSLCAQILRAHTVEAGLDPAFEVGDEVELSALLDQAIEEAITEAASDSTASQTASDINIFAYLSPREAQSALRSLVAMGERALSSIERLPHASAKDIYDYWRDRLREMKLQAALSLTKSDAWSQWSRTITTLRAVDVSDKREQCRACVAELLERLRPGPDDMSDKVGVLVEIAESINLRGGSKKKWRSEEEFFAVRDALERMREAIRRERLLWLSMNESDRAAAEATLYLARLHKRVRARFGALKQSRAILDFNDLEEMTAAMLSTHTEVREQYKERGLLRALMVDEFQDTSPLQSRILEMIAPRSEETFVIGDAKQSIYRFRGADVTIFRDARRELARVGGHEVGLLTCFRTHERLVCFVNHIFASVFEIESDYDTPYEEMEAVRQSFHESPSVELHVISQDKEADEKLDAAGLRELEAALVARRIEEIVSAGEHLVADEQGEARPPAYGDFALLFQASTNFEIYEHALREAGIPYVTTAGRGFYDRQEIADINNLLAFLVSPADNLSLAAALRSPIFALSDEMLLRLRLKKRSLWKSLCDESLEMPEAEREAVEFARATLTRLRSLVGRVSAAQVITAAVVDTGYLATLMALPHGERRVANIEKFIEQAAALRSLTLSEVVARIASLRFKEAREGEATIEETGAVRLMTIHKSKGLEFPFVWIVDASYAGGRDTDRVIAHPDYGIAVDVRVDTGPATDDPPRPASFEMLKQVEERMDRAEKKRLLYVAATRARDHLIISGTRITNENWLGRILQSLGINEPDSVQPVLYPGGSVAVKQWSATTEKSS